MPGIEGRIVTWREQMAAADSIDSETLRGLGSHLRDALDRRRRV